MRDRLAPLIRCLEVCFMISTSFILKIDVCIIVLNPLENQINTDSDEEYNDGPHVTTLNSLQSSLDRGDSLNVKEQRIYRRLKANSS